VILAIIGTSFCSIVTFLLRAIEEFISKVTIFKKGTQSTSTVPSLTAFRSAFFHKFAIFNAYFATKVNLVICTQSNTTTRKTSQFFGLQRKNQKAENKPKTARKPYFDPFFFAFQAKSWR